MAKYGIIKLMKMTEKVLVQDHILFSEILWKFPQNIYKRQRGKILIVAGSRGFSGAALLLLEAAFRTGAGLIVLGFPQGLKEVYRDILPETMLEPLPETPTGSLSLDGEAKILELTEECDVTTIGPGLSRNSETQQLVQKLVPQIKTPLIIDADGLNAISPSLFPKRQSATIITPHSGEMVNLLEKEGYQAPDRRPLMEHLYRHREEMTKDAAKRWKVILVLKGHQTVISDGERVVIDPIGGPELATAGTGDILTGIIATLATQNKSKLLEAAATAVYLHSQTGKKAKETLGERSVVASDIIRELPEVIKENEKKVVE